MLDDVMDKIEKIEQLVQALSAEELAQFRVWFLEFDWAAWDRQLEADVRAGRLEALGEQALSDQDTDERQSGRGQADSSDEPRDRTAPLGPRRGAGPRLRPRVLRLSRMTSLARSVA